MPPSRDLARVRCEVADAESHGGAKAGPAPTVSFVSLGCPKALVDSERIITRLRAEGYELARGAPGRRRW